MKNLIHAELLKLRTTRMIYGLALAAVAFAAINVVSAIASAGKSGGSPALGTGEGIRNVMSSGSSGAIIALIIGILIMAGEFRHSTVTSTFLVSPKRGRVVGAKIVASAMVGAGIAIVAAALTLAISIPWLASKHVHPQFFSHNVGVVLLGGIAATAIYAAVGVGLGSLIRNQMAAVIVALAWVLVVEALLVAFVPEVGRWIPGGAAAALTGVANRAASGGLLPMWAGALLLVGYGLVFAVSGARFTMRRDVS
jgi:ABC-2 type transport system permease protein